MTKITDITVILTAYRRIHLLEHQIEHIRKQTVQPKEIWVWRNFHEDQPADLDLNKLDVDVVCDCNLNFKYFARFAWALLANTECIAIFDDDTMPGSQWLENCVNEYQKCPGIFGGLGTIFNDPNNYMNHGRSGWATNNIDTTEVDFVSHAWFFNQQMAKHFWTENLLSWDTGEDMNLSYTAQKYGNFKTFCPPHPKDKPEMWSSLYPQLGVDKVTVSVVDHGSHFRWRTDCMQEGIRRGWQTINGLTI